MDKQDGLGLLLKAETESQDQAAEHKIQHVSVGWGLRGLSSLQDHSHQRDMQEKDK